MGFIPGIKAFTAAVLGGIGNIGGAVLGGFSLGILEQVGPNLFLTGYGVPAPNQLHDGIAFASSSSCSSSGRPASWEGRRTRDGVLLGRSAFAGADRRRRRHLRRPRRDGGTFQVATCSPTSSLSTVLPCSSRSLSAGTRTRRATRPRPARHDRAGARRRRRRRVRRGAGALALFAGRGQRAWIFVSQPVAERRRSPFGQGPAARGRDPDRWRDGARSGRAPSCTSFRRSRPRMVAIGGRHHRRARIMEQFFGPVLRKLSLDVAEASSTAGSADPERIILVYALVAGGVVWLVAARRRRARRLPGDADRPTAHRQADPVRRRRRRCSWSCHWSWASARATSSATPGSTSCSGLGLNIVVGYAGLLDLGYVAFFAIGAYSSRC